MNDEDGFLALAKARAKAQDGDLDARLRRILTWMFIVVGGLAGVVIALVIYQLAPGARP